MMTDTLIRYLEGVAAARDRAALLAVLKPLYDRQGSFAVSSAGLAIKAGASAIVKTGAAATLLLASNIPRSIAAATDMPALSGTVVNATFNVFCFFIDNAGTVTGQMGTAGATLATMKFPQFPPGKALVGFILVNPTGTGDFVGGTTALDDATVVPGVLYYNPVGPFDPYCIIGGL